MKTCLVLTTALCLLLFACNKSTSTNNNPNPPATAHLLQKIISTHSVNNEKDTVYYYYDTNNRLIKIVSRLSSTTGPYVDSTVFSRNSSGVITGIQALHFPYNVTLAYNATSNQYLYRLGSSDSVAYTYANGKISSLIDYQKSSGVYTPYNKRCFLYDSNGNLSRDSSYNWSSNWIYAFIKASTFDNKVSPLPQNYEMLLKDFDETNDFGPNNTTSESHHSFISNSDLLKTISYTYNSDNTPATATGSEGSDTWTSTYYYY